MSDKYKRETAKRTFIAELLQATEEVEEDNRSYVQLPSGGKANRVLTSGTVTSVEKGDTDNLMYKLRVSDPTGEITVTAFQEYNPEAYSVMRRTDEEIDDVPPAYVLIVGKPSTFEVETDDGDTERKVSLRAEQVRIVDGDERDLSLTENLIQLRKRLDDGESETDWLDESDFDALRRAFN